MCPRGERAAPLAGCSLATGMQSATAATLSPRKAAISRTTVTTGSLSAVSPRRRGAVLHHDFHPLVLGVFSREVCQTLPVEALHDLPPPATEPRAKRIVLVDLVRAHQGDRQQRGDV